MLLKIITVLMVILLAAPVLAGCGQSDEDPLTFSELISRAEEYNGKLVTFEAYYFSGFEISALAGSLGPAVYGPERIVLQGTLIWTTGIPSEVYEQLYIQTDTPSGYPEHFGKILVTGEFETGDVYGHMNAYHHKITITSGELLDWAPPASQS